MTAKLILLLILFFFKFEVMFSLQAMFSLEGDKNFVYKAATVASGTLVGFAYNDENNGFVVSNCTAKDTKTSFSLNADCTVETSGIFTDSVTTAGVHEEGFPMTGVNSNLMVATEDNESPLVQTTTTFTTSTSAFVAGTTAAANNYASSKILCNNYADTAAVFAADQTASKCGQVMLATFDATLHKPVTKCYVNIVDSNDAVRTITIILVVTAHTEMRFNLYGMTNIVSLIPSVDYNVTVGANVGYIDGAAACPPATHAKLTFPTGTSSCKGNITVKAVLTNDSFILFRYDDKEYYMNVTGASTTSSTTSTCTDSDSFAFNLKHSKTLFGILLIYVINMLKSY